MDMIDKVAAAIMTAQAHGGNLGAQARAAIEAMREPTPEMIESAWAEALGEDAAGVWRDMIEAALSPGQSTQEPK